MPVGKATDASFFKRVPPLRGLRSLIESISLLAHLNFDVGADRHSECV